MGDCVVTRTPESPYVFDHVDGRMDDVIITPEGRRIGRIDPAFKGIEGIELAQVVQEELNRITITVVVNKDKRHLFNESLLVENLKQRTSHLMDIKVNYQDTIAKSPNGKFKSVISKISK